jgi:hypothetical protein
MSKDIASLYADIGAKTDGLKMKLDEAKGQLTNFKGSFMELWGAIDLVKQGAQALNQFYDATVGETLAYADEVRSLSRLIGTTPEEASKLIQAGDDVKLSYQTISTALETAIRKGIEPSIEGIGDLADEYNDIQDPIAKSKFLMDTFGRAGADMAPLLEKGSVGIERLGDEAENFGLILDQDLINKTRTYELAVDELGDSLEGMKIKIGSEAIPALLDLGIVFQELWGAKNYSEVADTAAKFINNFFFDSREKAQAFYDTALVKSEDLGIETDDLAGSMDGLSGKVDLAAIAEEEMARQAEELARQEDLVKQSMDELSTFMSGRLGEENEKYEEKLGDLQTELEDTRVKIEELSNQDNLTEEQRGQLDELKGKYEDIQTQIGETADEHDEATKRILFDLLQQQLAVDGLSTAEATALGGVAESWGLIDPATRTAWERMQEYIGSLGTAQIDAEGLWQAINNIPNEKTVSLLVDTSQFAEYFQNPGLAQYTVLGYQTGADFVVPPGFAGDKFPFMASTGERVQVTPAGDVGNERGGGGNWGALAAEIQQLRNDILSQPRPATASEIARSVRDAILMASG